MITDLPGSLVIEQFRPDHIFCDGGIFIPGLPAERGWARGIRIILYGGALAYCFLGVAIIADRFMVAIEVITSKQKTVHLKNEKGELEAVQVSSYI